jgi:hypothetical protein
MFYVVVELHSGSASVAEVELMNNPVSAKPRIFYCPTMYIMYMHKTLWAT